MSRRIALFLFLSTFAFSSGAQDLGPKGAADVFNTMRIWEASKPKPKSERDKVRLENNYRELKLAAAELAYISNTLNQEINGGSEYVMSARVFDALDKIEKLTKQIKSKSKGF